jgi:hypothetical protein
MTLTDLIAAPLPPLDSLRLTWLVFDSSLRDTLDAAQEGETRNRAEAILLNNGRYALCADLLTETNGLYARTFSLLNPEHFPAVEVLDDESFRTLLIPPPEQP